MEAYDVTNALISLCIVVGVATVGRRHHADDPLVRRALGTALFHGQRQWAVQQRQKCRDYRRHQLLLLQIIIFEPL